MKRHDFSGVGVAIVTPFDKNEAVDFAALAQIVERIIAGGADYIVALGTTSESPTLTADERRAVAKFIKERTAGRVPLMIGIGGNCTREVVATLKSGITDGYDAVLSVCPYYNKPNQEGLYRHYTAIADASPLPVILYEVPSRTGLHVTPETYARLAVHDNIVALKDAAGDLERVPLIRFMTGDHLAVYSGSDGVTVPMLSVGAVGVISVLSNLCPYAVSEMCEAWFSGNTARAAELQCRYASLNRALFSEGNPIPVKCAMAQLGMCAEVFRLPLCPMNAEDSRRIAQMAEAFL